jgi:RimJ/RimL family protein N-acetyltransferase
MPGAVFLEAARVTLRTLEREDVDFVHEYKNRPGVRRTFLWPYPESRDDVEEYLFGDDDGTSLLVTVDEDGDPEPVGQVGMHVDDRTREAEIGVWIAEPYWGEGYGTEACERFVDYAFDERNVHRMMARHVEGNDGSRRIWEKLGFEHEGVHRESEFMGGTHRDMHVYGILEDEWRDRADD